MTLTTRHPTGKQPAPMVLIDGPEATGKTVEALSLVTDDRVGPVYVIEVGEAMADAYAGLGDFVIVEHDGTAAGIVAAIDAVFDEPPVDHRPPALILDSLTALWDLVKLDAERRARSTSKARDRIAADPDAEIDIAPNQWTAAKEAHWWPWLNRARSWPGIFVATARGDMVTAFENGRPTTDREYRAELEKGTPYMFTARIRAGYPSPPVLQWAHRLGLEVPGDGLTLTPGRAIAETVWELLGTGTEPAYSIRDAQRMLKAAALDAVAGNEPDARAVARTVWTDHNLDRFTEVPLGTLRGALDDVPFAAGELADNAARAAADDAHDDQAENEAEELEPAGENVDTPADVDENDPDAGADDVAVVNRARELADRMART